MTTPTGYVYITTQKEINKIYCQQTLNVACPYFVTYEKQGNVSDEVSKIKLFLNKTQGTTLDITSRVYDVQLVQAVKAFQTKYADKTLTPWGLLAPTGWWYQSTKKQANDLLGCFESVKLDNGTVIQ